MADPVASTPSSSERKRGPGRPKRPKAEPRWLSPAEMAELMDVPLVRIERVLSMRRTRLSFFSGAILDGDQWRIPAADLDGFLPIRTALEPLLRLSSVARLWDMPLRHVTHAAKTGKLPTVLILGTERRVRRSVALGAVVVPATKGRPRKGFSFFPGGGP